MKKVIALLSVISVLISCAKWVNEDISGETLVLTSPTDNQSDSLLAKTFSWEAMNGVDHYRLQIVSPKFDSVITNVLDSPVTATFFSTTLTPGEYEWRVRGENEDFQSKWAARSLTITSTESLNGQQVSNVSPTTGTNSNVMTHTFTWDALNSADNYLIQVNDGNSSQLVVDNTTNESYTYTFPSEGTFTFAIQGINTISASLNNEIVVLIDTTMPATPTLNFPSYDTLRSFPQNFAWTADANTGSVITETLNIASDSAMTNILFDTTFVANSPISLDSVETSGKLFWQIIRNDAAGNSNTSPVKGFWIF